jgi:hypothetical protein
MDDQEFLDDLAERMSTQNNRATADPLFIVQHQVRAPCYHDSEASGWDLLYCGEVTARAVNLDDGRVKVTWEDEEGEEVTDEFDSLEDFHDDYRVVGTNAEFAGVDDWVAYQWIWEIWSSTGGSGEIGAIAFTAAGVQAIIDRKRHDMRNPRIYVASAYWCPEIRRLQDLLRSGRLVVRAEVAE